MTEVSYKKDYVDESMCAYWNISCNLCAYSNKQTSSLSILSSKQVKKLMIFLKIYLEN